MSFIAPSFDKAIEKIRWVILNFGKDIEFITQTTIENKRDPSNTQITETSNFVKGLWKYQSSSPSPKGLTTEVGDFDVDKVIVTILADSYPSVANSNYFVINNVTYKIKKFAPAVGFKTTTDRYYVIGERKKK